ncbi:MAG: YggT family protein [Bacillota bacterium]|nr:YggT family protein [Bacillota bacterium]
MILSILVNTVNLFFSILYLAIIIRAILSWFPVQARWYWDLMRFLDLLTEPVVTPIRRVLPPMGGLDFSPLVALILLRVIQSLLVQLLVALLH